MPSEDDAEADETWDAGAYDDQCAFVYEYGESVTDLLSVDTGARLLDVGCGTGHLSRQLADEGVTVVGIDSSEEMIRRARASHGDVSNLQFVHGDARHLREALDGLSNEPFDAAFSNAALHWIPASDHDAVLANVAGILTSGGEFVAELGGHGNVARVVSAVRAELAARGLTPENPWYFPSVGEYAPRLEAHGLEVRQAHLFDRPTELEHGDDGLREWLAMFGDELLSAVPEEAYDDVVDAVCRRLRPALFEEGAWVVDYRRLRFRAVLDSSLSGDGPSN